MKVSRTVLKSGRGGDLFADFNENQVICVENLNVKGMVKNHNLAKAISQVGWGMFCTMLKYKADNAGKVYQEVDRFFPSSKTCNVCLNQVKSLPLDIRYWDCDNCGTKHIDRDINAAKISEMKVYEFWLQELELQPIVQM